MRACILILFLSLSLFAACGDDVDCENITDINSRITTATEAINSAITSWNNSDQSDDQCNTLRKAYDTYIDALEDVRDCSDTVGGQITSAQSERNQLPCA